MKFEIGYNHSFEVRKETCMAGNGAAFSVLYLSDLHFNKYSEPITAEIISSINELDPDIILFGGDYADSKSGLKYLNNLMQAVSGRENVFGIAGNHDYFSGLDEIKNIMTAHNATWIEKSSFIFKLKNTRIRIDGNTPGGEKEQGTFSILCLHKPINIEPYKDSYDMVFAGHLHGGQFILWRSGNGLYPGKFFYKWNILKARMNACYYFISKGLGDTLPIRYNCKRDLLFIEVASNHEFKLSTI
jgi:predicted MPP superfamily phosphohydrolase